MKKRILRITFLLLIIGTVFYFNGGLEKLMKSSTVQAFGDLLVDFHVPLGDPIFTLTNMKPGDSESRPIDVSNNGTVDRFIAIRGIRTGGVGSDPKIETVLDVVISDGVTPLYGNGSPTGPKTMFDFFSDSSAANGIPLNIIDDGDGKTYNFLVNFPDSADNQFQAKSVLADISFGIITGENLVVNEVFYNVDDSHGLKDKKEKDIIKTRQKFQWIEIYNPTDSDISLKNWSINNESGRFILIHPNKKIRAGGFALISKDGSVWKYWNNPRDALKVEIGNYLGQGMDINGDVLILKNSSGVEVDRMSWGDNTSGFTPPGVNPKVDPGHSTERQVPGFDTNVAFDWLDQNPPTPGN